jgi:hypothetical protein
LQFDRVEELRIEFHKDFREGTRLLANLNESNNERIKVFEILLERIRDRDSMIEILSNLGNNSFQFWVFGFFMENRESRLNIYSAI